jgi:exosortase/archaeosortase family protein
MTSAFTKTPTQRSQTRSDRPERGTVVVIALRRRVASLSFGTAAIASAACIGATTQAEAMLAPITFRAAGLGPARHLGGQRFLAMGTGGPIDFRISTQCGVMLLIVPLMIVAALVVRSPTVPTRRAFAAVFGGALFLVAANQLRLVIIGYCAKWFGFTTGFPLGHLIIGSLWSLAAVGLSIVVFARLAGARRVAAASGRVQKGQVHGAISG